MTAEPLTPFQTGVDQGLVRAEYPAADRLETPAAGLNALAKMLTESLDRADKLLINMAELARLTSLSIRHLRRLDSSRDIPGRVVVGRRVLFQTESIREWVRAGLPGQNQWNALQTHNRRR